MKKILAFILITFLALTSQSFAQNTDIQKEELKGKLLLTILKQKMNEGDKEAIKGLAFVNLEGFPGTTPDINEAFRFMKMSADNGDAMSQDTLGMMYAHGMGTPQNYDMAIEYHLQAAENNWTGAFFNIGMMCFFGEGTDRDFNKAIEYIGEGAKRGDKKAMQFMGRVEDMKKFFNEYPNDPQWKAKKEFSSARNLANAGYPEKQYELALRIMPFSIMHENFYNETKGWLEKAAYKGHPKAKEVLNEMINDDGSKKYLKHAFNTDVDLSNLNSPNYQ